MPIVPPIIPSIPPPLRKRLPWLLVMVVGFIALVGFWSSGFSTVAQSALPGLIVAGVTPNQSSARVFYQPVAGARDYRIYDVANPNDVKYAGLAHYTPDGGGCPGNGCLHHFATDSSGNVIYPLQILADNTVQSGPNSVQNVPATDIEWNGLGDGAAHTLIVQAVDALGPVPQSSLYQGPPNGAKTPLAPGGMLGANKGATMDGKTSTNGQGPYTDNPNVIAQSQPFVVTPAVAYTPLGKLPGASQAFYDTFDQSEAASLHRTVNDVCGTDAVGDQGVQTYTLNAGTAKEWGIEMRQMDGDNSMPFISSGHFMDMLFSGSSASCGGGTDTLFGSLALTPKQTVTMGPGTILHQTMEVDAHSDFNRWVAFDLSPAADPIQTWEPDLHQVNTHNQALYLDLLGERLDVRVFNGGSGVVSPAFATGAALGQLYIPNDDMQSGRGFDDRSKLDLFVSQTHMALFEDNTLVFQTDIPASSMSWFTGAVKTYYSHYEYHSDNDVTFLRTGNLSGMTFCYPMNAYWFNDPVNGLSAGQDVCGIPYSPGYGFPHSDERHWDNMGFEVVPASATAANDFSSLGASVALGQPQPPQFVNSPPPTVSPAGTSTAQPTNTVTPASTNTPTPAASPTCQVWVQINGVTQWLTKSSTFCTSP